MSIIVEELEDQLITCMRWDCATLAMKWVLGRDRKKAKDRDDLSMLKRCMEEDRDFEVMVGKAEECVKDVIGMLIWLDRRTKH